MSLEQHRLSDSRYLRQERMLLARVLMHTHAASQCTEVRRDHARDDRGGSMERDPSKQDVGY
jgi:hypothetical protein